MTHGFIPSVTLNDGIQLPALGFGTYKLNGSSGLQGMAAAIACGYRLLDSAFNYENEGALGAAIRKAGVPREELRNGSTATAASNKTRAPGETQVSPAPNLVFKEKSQPRY